MKRLWAPWRRAYIRPETARPKGCFFCRVRSQKNDAANLVLARSRFSFAVLNLYPYNGGHVMIVPNRHVGLPGQLTDAEKLDWLGLFERTLAAIRKALKPDGFNAGMNFGRTAGAGVPGHLHWHLVPRWSGDTNFMPVLAGTKVVSESLESVYRLLGRALRGRRS